MKFLDKLDKLCLRDKDTDKLVAVYPHNIEGSPEEMEDKVRFWFYQQSCSAENELDNYYVDTLTENELEKLGERSEMHDYCGSIGISPEDQRRNGCD